jgi:hypothetical protein
LPHPSQVGQTQDGPGDCGRRDSERCCRHLREQGCAVGSAVGVGGAGCGGCPRRVGLGSGLGKGGQGRFTSRKEKPEGGFPVVTVGGKGEAVWIIFSDEPWSAGDGFGGIRGFNPCCVGSPSPTAAGWPRCRPRSSSFNPCCVGSPSPTARERQDALLAQALFQSLLCWITFSDSMTRSTLTRRTVFQSLLCWITFSDLSRRPRYRQAHRWVSILVVLDHLLRLHQVVGVVDEGVAVSILVVLDHLLRRAIAAMPEGAQKDMFQSLLCWITFSDLIKASGQATSLLFQSLLCWITFSDSQPLLRRDAPRRVSILVVLDHLLRRRPIRGVLVSRRVSILVVLDHLLRLRSFGVPTGGWRRFNPCCVGSPSPTARERQDALLAQALFQSLLCWITFSDNKRRGDTPFAEAMFQSLLCWITFSDKMLAIRGSSGTKGFNPCCLDGFDRRFGQRRHSSSGKASGNSCKKGTAGPLRRRLVGLPEWEHHPPPR